MRDFLEFSGFLAAALLVGALVTGGLILTAEYTLARPSCYAEWRDSGNQVRWSLFSGCQLSTDGKLWFGDEVIVSTHKSITIEK